MVDIHGLTTRCNPVGGPDHSIVVHRDMIILFNIQVRLPRSGIDDGEDFGPNAMPVVLCIRLVDLGIECVLSGRTPSVVGQPHGNASR